MEKKVRVALIGVGGMGRKYAEMIDRGEVPSLALAALVCRKEAARQWAKTLRADPVIYGDTDALFAHPDGYDAVLVVTPHKTHPLLVCQAFAMGKDVLCDKPAGVSVSDAMRMDEAARKAGRIYGMVFHQRLYPKYRTIRDLLQKGEIGRPERMMMVNTRYFRTAHYHHSGSWRSSWNGEGGGALINQGQHLLDIWQWLFGMPTRLYAQIPFGKYNDFLVDDEATIQMEYPDKQTAVFFLTTGESVRQERLEIMGSRGRILMDEDTLHIWRCRPDAREYMRTAQTNSREQLELSEEVISFEPTVEPYAQLLENFGQAVANRAPDMLVAPGAEAVNALTLANAAYLSAWQKAPVSLPIDKEEYDRRLAEKMAEEAREG